MKKYTEFGYNVESKSYTEDELEMYLLSNPDDIVSAILYHNKMGSLYLNQGADKITTTYDVCLFSDEKSLIKNKEENGTPFYIFKTDGIVVDNIVSLRLKSIKTGEKKINIKQTTFAPIICKFDSLELALEDLGYTLDNIDFDDICEFITSSDECTLKIEHQKNATRVKRTLK